MTKFTQKLSSQFIWVMWIVMILCIISFFRSCTLSNQVKRVERELIETKTEIHDFKEMFWTKEEFDTRLSIHGLETSKRTLYDWNAVVRTVVRPDDRMREYDKKIDEERRKLE